MLVSTARSGTNYLLAVYQKCFPDEFVVKEIFRRDGDSFQQLEKLLRINNDEAIRMARYDALGLWQKVKVAAARGNRRAAAKIFYYHQQSSDPIWSHFKSNDQVIHLIRRNPFDVLVSLKVATLTNKWMDFGEKNSRPKDVGLSLDRSEVLSFIQEQHDYVEAKREFFRGADYHEVFYEDVKDSENTLAATLCAMRGVDAPSAPVKIGLKKQKVRSNAEIVLNYDAVADLDRQYF